MDTAQWPQEIVVKPMEEIVVPKGTTSTTTICSNSSKPTSSTSSLERRTRPHQKEQVVNCPRCNSTNTKFCYYNNYSLSQPRYFCKTCRRYWTEGGSLRNIPVGGGSRKNKRPSSSSSSSSSISNPSSTPSKNLITLPDLVQAPSSSSHHQNPNNKIFDHHGQDLNLGFPSTHDFKTISELIQVPSFDGNSTKSNLQTTNSTTSGNNSSHLSALELLTGITTRGLNSFMPMPIPDPNAVYSSGFSFPEFKVPSLGFSLDGIGSNINGYGSLQENGNGGRLLFPFEDLKQVSSTTTASQHDDHHVDQSRDHQNGDSNGYWNGMLGGGSW